MKNFKLFYTLLFVVVLMPLNVVALDSCMQKENSFIYKIDGEIWLSIYMFTELGYHSYFGNFDKVKELVESGADIGDGMCTDYFVYGAISCAIRSGKVDIVKYMISRKAEVNAISSESGITPLFTAIRDCEDSEKSLIITKLLLEAGAKPNGGGYLGFNDIITFYPMIEAVKRGYVETVKLLIEYGADFEFKNSEVPSIVELASQLEDKEKAKIIKDLLIKAGAK